ncbi:MAG: Gfo/Idh/MocA family oxidoreductase, partial [Bacillus sp. (in: firmicutes)]
VKAIYTRNGRKDAGLATTYHFVKEYEEILDNKEIDIVDICLPSYLHEDFIVKAAKAGKHIICEKPLTLTVESAHRILQEVNRNQVILFVGHVLRFWPEYEIIKSYSESDLLRTIEVVHAKRIGQSPAWSNWFQFPKKSGGALFDLHIHDIDFVSYILGKVESVYAVGTKNSYGAWDHVMTTLTFQNQSKAFVEASQRMPKGYPFTMSFRAQTSQSVLDFHLAAGENIEHLTQGDYHFWYYTHEKKVPITLDSSDAFEKELSYFVNCIEKGEANQVIPNEDVLYRLQVLEAIERSLETKSEIRL